MKYYVKTKKHVIRITSEITGDLDESSLYE